MRLARQKHDSPLRLEISEKSQNQVEMRKRVHGHGEFQSVLRELDTVFKRPRESIADDRSDLGEFPSSDLGGNLLGKGGDVGEVG